MQKQHDKKKDYKELVDKYRSMKLNHHFNENYRNIKEMLNGKTRKKIGNNTYLETSQYNGDLDKDSIGYRLHNTDVAIFNPTYIELTTGGWNTMTTYERINRAIKLATNGSYNHYVYSHRGTRYYGTGDWHNDKVFEDGMRISYSGDLINENEVIAVEDLGFRE